MLRLHSRTTFHGAEGAVRPAHVAQPRPRKTKDRVYCFLFAEQKIILCSLQWKTQEIQTVQPVCCCVMPSVCVCSSIFHWPDPLDPSLPLSFFISYLLPICPTFSLLPTAHFTRRLPHVFSREAGRWLLCALPRDVMTSYSCTPVPWTQGWESRTWLKGSEWSARPFLLAVLLLVKLTFFYSGMKWPSGQWEMSRHARRAVSAWLFLNFCCFRWSVMV